MKTTSAILPLAVMIAAAFATGCTTATPDYLSESQAEFDARMEWWRDARFGMFIHWCAYAVPAGEYRG